MITRLPPIVSACLMILFSLSPWPGPAAAQVVRSGYQLDTDPQGTAALIVAQRPARSATAALAQGIAEVATAFDAKPALLGAFRDVRDQTAEAGFVNAPNTLVEFNVHAVTEGIDAIGEVTVRLQAENGSIPRRTSPQNEKTQARTFGGYGADTDIIVASAKAYLTALNKLLFAKGLYRQPEFLAAAE